MPRTKRPRLSKGEALAADDEILEENVKISKQTVAKEEIVTKSLSESISIDQPLVKLLSDENGLITHLASILNEDTIVNAQIITMTKDQASFSKLCEMVGDKIISECSSSTSNPNTIIVLVRFFIMAYQHVEIDIVKKSLLRLISLPILVDLSNMSLQKLLDQSETLQNHWQTFHDHRKALLGSQQLQKKKSTSSSASASSSSSSNNAVAQALLRDEQVVPSLLHYVEHLLSNKINKNSNEKMNVDNGEEDEENDEVISDEEYQCLLYILALFVQLLSQPTTRRYLAILLDDYHLVLKLQRTLYFGSTSSPLEKVFVTLTKQLDYYLYRLHINDQAFLSPSSTTSSGVVILSKTDQIEEKNNRVSLLQQIAFTHYPHQLRDIVYSSMKVIMTSELLDRYLEILPIEDMIRVATLLHIWTDKDTAANHSNSRDFAKALILQYLCSSTEYEKRVEKPVIYPTEQELWSPEVILYSSTYAVNKNADDLKRIIMLCWPKLSLQYLSFTDYWMRNYQLYRLECTHEIHEDLQPAIMRMQPKQALTGRAAFDGHCEMATGIDNVIVEQVNQPRLGDVIPERVMITVTIDIVKFSGEVRNQWEDLREHDVLFLVLIDHPKNIQHEETSSADFLTDYGVKCIRGGEIYEYKDESDTVLNTNDDDKQQPASQKLRVGTKRKLRLSVDPYQYYQDTQAGHGDYYERFNLIIRRNPRQNNFKAILQTIRDLVMKNSYQQQHVEELLPVWLHDLILGKGGNIQDHPYINSNAKQRLPKGQIMDFGDTFLDEEHIRESYLQSVTSTTVVIEASSAIAPPYVLQFDAAENCTKDAASTTASASGKKAGATKRKASSSSAATTSDVVASSSDAEAVVTIKVSQAYRKKKGPYPENIPKMNTVRYTPKQIQAIQAGMQTGLAMIVGPPGSGKTDCAVQMINNLYHSYPHQKIVIVTQSNAALNDLFSKLIQRDIDPRHLLRLGGGERELRDSLNVGFNQQQQQQSVTSMLETSFDKHGRINYSLFRRMQLLGQVQRLAQSLAYLGDAGQSCETAAYFYTANIVPRVQNYINAREKALLLQEQQNNNNTKSGKASGNKTSSNKKAASMTTTSTSSASAAAVAEPVSTSSSVSAEVIFPFANFFADVPNLQQDPEVIDSCLVYLENLFNELQDYRAYELLRTPALRSDYLLTKQARIVAMTCKHASHNADLIIEESAQILEVETFLPMLLQEVDEMRLDREIRLKRIVLLGDHHQLPPIIQHQGVKNHCGLEQSMFHRLIRLGVPYVQLDQQGRAREEIAALYAWRYQDEASQQKLGNLPIVKESPEYQVANAGLAYTFQWIDVHDFQGKGETSPASYSYQNLGEAEYVVAMYQYMRLCGYPAAKISILTTYSGQRSLIQEILKKRCGGRQTRFGYPAHVSTVDRFQGQQNDYILLSLVRTRSLGHFQDIRRLVVALSRARLGLYIFGRKELFDTAIELKPAMNIFDTLPIKLTLVAGEEYPSSRSSQQKVKQGDTLAVEDVTAMGILVYQMSQQQQQHA